MKKENEVTFTVYFPSRKLVETFLTDKRIKFRISDTGFITWISVDKKHKEVFDKFIMKNSLQDGMDDEFKWNGWMNWGDGNEDRERLGRKQY